MFLNTIRGRLLLCCPRFLSSIDDCDGVLFDKFIDDDRRANVDALAAKASLATAVSS